MSDIENYNFCEETKLLKNKIENSFLELGERLLKIRDQNLYTPQWSSFTEYVWELKWSEAKASKLINIYQKFVLNYGFPTERLLNAGGWSGLAEVLALVKDKESAEYWLHELEISSRPDLRVKIKEFVTGIEQADCLHPDNYVLKICRACGLKEKVLEA